MGQDSRVRDVAVLVCFATIDDTTQHWHTSSTNPRCHTSKHVRKDLGTHVVMTSAHLVSRTELEQSLLTEEAARVTYLVRQTKSNHLVHTIKANVRVDVCLQVLHRFHRLPP